MFVRTKGGFHAGGLAALVVLAVASASRAGGFALTAEIPDAADPRLRDAVVVVRAYGCVATGVKSLSGTAEGWVNGKRRSIPVELKAAAPNVFALRQRLPAGGTWVLALRNLYAGAKGDGVGDALIALRAGGTGRDLPVLMVYRKLTAAEIDAALRSSVAKTAKSAGVAAFDK